MAGITGTFALIINISIGLNIYITVTTLILAISFFGLFLLSKNSSNHMKLVYPYILILISLLSFIWFVNAGLAGPTPFTFLIALFVLNIISKGFNRFAISAIFITVIVSLIFIEYFHPEYVIDYSNEKEKFLDIGFTITYMSIMLTLIVSFLMTNYYDEREKVLAQRDTILDQNKEIEATKLDLIKYQEHLEDQVKERTKELEIAKEKAEESDRLKTAFLSNMSHEIRTPMNSIIGFSQLMKSRTLSEEKQLEYIDIISKKGYFLMNIINDIIDVAKIEANKINIINSPTNINDLLKEIEVTFINNIPNEKLNLKLINDSNNSQQEIYALTDNIRIKQVLSNLVDNAIKNTNTGYIRFGVDFTKYDDVEYLKFYVKDSGIGIPEDKINIIFDRFRQIDESNTREIGGTGLGLTISKKLVELLGGTLWVKSIINIGSEFYFTIPYIKCEAQYKDDNSNLDIDHNWSDKTILIAEDDEFNFQILNDVFKDTKINIIRAKDGEEVLSICKSDSSINLLLLDIQMPKLNGYDVCKELIKNNFKIPIIAQTAFVMEEDKEKLMQHGCVEVITKPIDFQKLLYSVNKYIAN